MLVRGDDDILNSSTIPISILRRRAFGKVVVKNAYSSDNFMSRQLY